MRVVQLAERTAQGVDKTARYGWVTKDEPGTLQMLHKDSLHIDPTYQRDIVQPKVAAITAAWSWVSLGAIVVGKRDGRYWVIDGQHRALAAKRRSDISHLPCVVFETAGVKEEARGFLDLNTGRKPVTAIGKQKALVAAGDEVADFVQRTVESVGLEIVEAAMTTGKMKCVAWCIRRAAEDKSAFQSVLALGAELSLHDDIPVQEKLLEGLWVLNQKCGDGLDDRRLVKRLREKGAKALLAAANRAGAYYAKGGGNVWANGMLAEVNKGLRIKFAMEGEAA